MVKEVAVAYCNVKLQYLPASSKNCRFSGSDSKQGLACYEASTTGCRFVYPCFVSRWRQGAVRFHSSFLAVNTFVLSCRSFV